jgi:hypothetical protein
MKEGTGAGKRRVRLMGVSAVRPTSGL